METTFGKESCRKNVYTKIFSGFTESIISSSRFLAVTGSEVVFSQLGREERQERQSAGGVSRTSLRMDTRSSSTIHCMCIRQSITLKSWFEASSLTTKSGMELLVNNPL